MKIITTVAVATLVAFGASPAAAQKITFTLNWVAGGDHAPYFYAQKMGWYKDAGVNVEFETGRGSAASAQKVGAGSSQLGLSDMAGVLLFRGKGLDLVGLMNANAKLGALKAKTVDATTSFFNLHHVFARELGEDMGFLAWKDAGVNPYGNSIIANGPWLK